MKFMTIIKVDKKNSPDVIRYFSRYIGQTHIIDSVTDRGYVLRAINGEYHFWLFSEVRPSTKEEIKKVEMELLAMKI